MSGKTSIKNELIEELMEAVSIQGNFAENVGKILEYLNQNEALDHKDDTIRSEAMNFFLSGLEAYNAKDYEGMQKYLHAGIQKLNSQGVVDFQDDKPRIDAKIELLQTQIKAIHNKERLTNLLAKIGGRKDVSSDR